ncbi:MAG: hypothetical protein ABJA64_00690 [Candidatus Saccharibacteria bacterium]
MDTLIIVLLIVVLAELTYLLANSPTKVAVIKRVGRPIFVDTSVLIDGRIIAVAQSGFIGDTLVIPRSVIGELQFLADNADHEKRSRARYGLDVVKELQNMPHLTVEILQDGSKAEEGVDERLLKLAKEQNGAVCTIDFNLNKVAQVEGIAVLNVNELAQSLRMAYLPGEKMLLELVQKGQDSHQAVGYLTDGTMVVVEHANKLIGQKAEIEFIRSLQTAAGKMMFAKLVSPEKPVKLAQNKKPQGRAASAPVAATQTPSPIVATASRSERKPNTNNRKSKNAPKKIRSSAQNEASLINLVNNQ